MHRMINAGAPLLAETRKVEFDIAEKRLVAHNLVKHFEWVVDMMYPMPGPSVGPFKELTRALEGEDVRRRGVVLLKAERDRLVRELGL